MTPSPSASGQKYTPQQINQIARSLIKQQAVAMEQQIFANTYSAASGNISSVIPIVYVQPRNVGLIRGFWIKVQATVTNGSGVQIDLSNFGPANLLTQIQFNDLNNNTRIQTTGWHMAILNAIKGRRPFGGALVNGTGIASGTQAGNSNMPIDYGDNWIAQIQAPATIAAAGSGTVLMWYYVPLAYSNDDLRGAVYANVVNATMQLNLTPNPTPVVANATDSTQAIYIGHAAGSVAAAVISAMTVTVYQDYLDQLPSGAGGVLLPILDLATIYEMKNTNFTAITATQDFPMQYSNFRQFLSTVAIYVNTSSSGARGVGADINYWALQSANFTNIWKLEPGLVALKTRNHLQTDLPPGTYYFGSRGKPISTVQYGNMQLILNASTANAGAYVLAGYEDFALVSQLSMAGSLAAS
jgi:P3 major capsid protein